MKIRLGSSDRIWVDGIACEFRATTSKGHILRSVGSELDREEIQHKTFVAGYNDGSIRIDRDHFKHANTYGRRGPPVADDVSCLSEEDSAETLFRLKYVERFVVLHKAGLVARTDEGYALAAHTIHEEFRVDALNEIRARGGRAPRGGTTSAERTAPSGPQLRRWCENYSKSGVGGLSSRMQRCGNFTPRLEKAVEMMLARAIDTYCSRNQPNAKQIHRRLRRMVSFCNAKYGTALKAPSYQTVCTRINELPDVDREVGRTSFEEAQLKFAIGRGGLETRNLLERVEVDEWRVDLFVLLVEADVWRHLSAEERQVLKPVRCWITAAICCTSSVILGLGLSLNAPSARSAIDAIRQILEDKTSRAQAAGARTSWAFYGTPSTLGMDKGSGLAADETKRVTLDLRCSIPSPPAKLPPMRGSIERWFGTIGRDLLPFFTGRAFHNVKARGAYDGQALASLHVPLLEKAAIRYVCDIYHRQPQAALGGRSPAQVWAREMAKGGVLPPPPREKMRDIFGVRLVRTLGKKGIRVAGVQYHSEQLDEIWLRDGGGLLEIKVDKDDMSAISVSIGRAQWISVNAVSGLSISAEEALAALKLAAAMPPSEFDDPIENANIVDQAYADLEELGVAARIEAGVADPVATPADRKALRKRHRDLWQARDAKRNSAALDHLEGRDAKPKRRAGKRSSGKAATQDTQKGQAPHAIDRVVAEPVRTEPVSKSSHDAAPTPPRITVKR